MKTSLCLISTCLLAALSGCGMNDKEPSRTAEKWAGTEITTYKIQPKVDEPQHLPTAYRSIYDGLTHQKPVPYSVIADLLAERHRYSFNKANPKSPIDRTALRGKLKELSSALNLTTSVTLKAAFESLLERNLKAKVLYSISASNIMDILQTQKLNAYSANVLFQIALRQSRSMLEFRNLKSVMVLTPGHMLSGFMIPIDAANKIYQLKAYDFLFAGNAEVDFGKTSELKGPIRVLDTELFHLLELFRGWSTNDADLITKAEQLTSEVYGIKISVPAPLDPKKASLYFGASQIESHPFERKTRNSTPAQNYYDGSVFLP